MCDWSSLQPYFWGHNLSPVLCIPCQDKPHMPLTNFDRLYHCQVLHFSLGQSFFLGGPSPCRSAHDIQLSETLKEKADQVIPDSISREEKSLTRCTLIWNDSCPLTSIEAMCMCVNLCVCVRVCVFKSWSDWLCPIPPLSAPPSHLDLHRGWKGAMALRHILPHRKPVLALGLLCSRVRDTGPRKARSKSI